MLDDPYAQGAHLPNYLTPDRAVRFFIVDSIGFMLDKLDYETSKLVLSDLASKVKLKAHEPPSYDIAPSAAPKGYTF